MKKNPLLRKRVYLSFQLGMFGAWLVGPATFKPTVERSHQKQGYMVEETAYFVAAEKKRRNWVLTIPFKSRPPITSDLP